MESPQTGFGGVFKASELSEWVPRALKLLLEVTLCVTLGFCFLYCSGGLVGAAGRLGHQPASWAWSVQSLSALDLVEKEDISADVII